MPLSFANKGHACTAPPVAGAPSFLCSIRFGSVMPRLLRPGIERESDGSLRWLREQERRDSRCQRNHGCRVHGSRDTDETANETSRKAHRLPYSVAPILVPPICSYTTCRKRG